MKCMCAGHEGMPCRNHDKDCKCGRKRNSEQKELKEKKEK